MAVPYVKRLQIFEFFLFSLRALIGRRTVLSGWAGFLLIGEAAALDTVIDSQIVTGEVTDTQSGQLLACRAYLRNSATGEWLFPKPVDPSATAIEYRRQIGQTQSLEMHTTLSAHPFQIALTPGRYKVEVVRGKEFLPAIQEFEVGDKPVQLKIPLHRFINLQESGWFSGDTHVHRPMTEIPNVILAEDLNVAFPMTYWVRDSLEMPSASGPADERSSLSVAPNHFIYLLNTEYEIFSVNGKRHTQGAVLVLNHKRPLNIPAPPSLSVAEEARRQGGLLDLEKHSWAWSMMIVPVMNVDLFELSNNHNWRTEFAFPQWTIENAPNWPEVERNAAGLTEQGWTHFALQTYYALLNCGFRMRIMLARVRAYILFRSDTVGSMFTQEIHSPMNNGSNI